jgi:hypothetical protein
MASKPDVSRGVDRFQLGGSFCVQTLSSRSVSRGGKGGMSRELREVSHNITHNSETFLERFENRITLANPRFVERYIKSEINILVDFRIRGINEQYIACFQREKRDSGSNVDILSDVNDECLPVTRVPLNPSWFAVTNVCPVLVNIELTQASAGSNEQTMFVNPVQLMEFPEGFIPSFVRFEVRNDLLSRWRHVSYLSKKFGVFDLGRIKDGKGSAIRGVWRERTNQIVESGSQMLERVTSDQHHFAGNVCDLSHVIDRLSGVRVLIASDYVGVGILEPEQCILEIFDVLIGPFDFGLSAADLI